MESRRNILSMPIPKFYTLRPDIDEKLEVILQKALQRDRDKRYQTAYDMLNDLELYLYSDRYGPTNEKLGVYIKQLMGYVPPGTSPSFSINPVPVKAAVSR
jgi:serine/threonine-protein kinase